MIRETRERLLAMQVDSHKAPGIRICEVPSPSTEAIDRGQKLRIYARALWI